VISHAVDQDLALARTVPPKLMRAFTMRLE
jgi:hypothetical protein